MIEIKNIYGNQSSRTGTYFAYAFGMAAFAVGIYLAYFVEVEEFDKLDHSLIKFFVSVSMFYLFYAFGPPKVWRRRGELNAPYGWKYSSLGFQVENQIIPWGNFSAAKRFKNEQGELLAFYTESDETRQLFSGGLKQEDIDLRTRAYGTPIILYFYPVKPFSEDVIDEVSACIN